MVNPKTDPHYLIGYDHAVCQEEPYTFQDTENQRRYDIGYRAGLAAHHPTKVPPERLWSQKPMIDLAKLQQNMPQTFRVAVRSDGTLGYLPKP